MGRELVETWNGLGNKPSLLPTVDLIDAACKHQSFRIINFVFPHFKLLVHYILKFFLCMEISLIFCFSFYLLCRRGNNHFDVHFRRIGPVLFSVERWKRRGPGGKKWMESCLFPARVGISPLINNMIKVLFPICTLIWRVNNYVSRQGKVEIGEKKVQVIIIQIVAFGFVPILVKIILTV